MWKKEGFLTLERTVLPVAKKFSERRHNNLPMSSAT